MARTKVSVWLLCFMSNLQYLVNCLSFCFLRFYSLNTNVITFLCLIYNVCFTSTMYCQFYKPVFRFMDFVLLDTDELNCICVLNYFQLNHLFACIIPSAILIQSPNHRLMLFVCNLCDSKYILAEQTEFFHYDVIKWQHFPRTRSFVRGIHRFF